MPRKRISDNELVVSAVAPPRRNPVTARRVKYTAPPAEKPLEPATAAACDPSPDEIARLAYSYWEARAYAGGSPEEDWLRAQRELRGK